MSRNCWLIKLLRMWDMASASKACRLTLVCFNGMQAATYWKRLLFFSCFYVCVTSCHWTVVSQLPQYVLQLIDIILVEYWRLDQMMYLDGSVCVRVFKKCVCVHHLHNALSWNTPLPPGMLFAHSTITSLVLEAMAWSVRRYRNDNFLLPQDAT